MTNEELQKVSDSMLNAARHLVEWCTAHLKLEVLLITDPWHDSDGTTQKALDEMNKAAKQIKSVTKNLKKLCDCLSIPFPHPEIGGVDDPDKVVKYAIKIHQRAEELMTR